MRLQWQPVLLFAASWTALATARSNFSSVSLLPSDVSVFDERPPNCPPCFNCNLEDFQCQQYGDCIKANGRCACPPGFGGVECAEPLCGHLNATDRAPRPADQQSCQCDEGWEGINCNVCKTNDACSALIPGGKDGICYREGLVQKQNHQICDVTNKKIVDQLDPKLPQVTFSCDATSAECNFQFWVDQVESFYCALDTCTWTLDTEPNRNTTKYHCEHIKCSCIEDRMLCGQGGSVDIGDFLTEEIKGPASFTSVTTEGGSPKDGSTFSEPAMNDLISTIFGDKTITLSCHSGECLYRTDVPGYEKPVKKINTPLIAGVIAGCALLVVALVLVVWYMSRRSSKSDYGPLHLSRDESDEDAQLMANHKPASLHFENVSYNLAGKQILSGVQGAVHAGELMAIMGASGAGKTTFLDILARKNKKGTSRGDFYINGETVADDDFRSVIGFVDQDDTMLPTLTVHETIMDSALLRLPRDMTLIAKEQRVDDVERQLGIHHIRDQLIGSEESNNRGISGGEKRRVGIACELVTSPSILYLDEPTSGLDAYNAYNVVECLVNLVKTYNRTVVFTIHQPRSNIVALFDQLVLLAKGRTVYSGPFANCQSYFDSIGYPCPPGFNIADYLVDLTMHAGLVKEPIDDIVDEATDGNYTRSSSTRAIKSIASMSNLSAVPSQYGSPSAESLLRRPKEKRRTSLKQQQERAHFSRQKSNTEFDGSTTTRSEEEASLLEQPRETSQAWLKLSKQSGNIPPQILDDSHNLPPVSNATGTDLDSLVESYINSDVASGIRSEIKELILSAHSANGNNPDGQANGHSKPHVQRMKGYRKVGILGQFRILSRRTWRNLYRNPMLMLTHYAIAILLAVLVGTLFYGLTDDIPGFQNRLGIFFFVLALFGFSTLTTLTVFAPERLLFTRERAKGYYAPISYFASKVLFDIVPLRLLPPMILGAIVYPMTGLVPAWSEFFTFIMFLVLFNMAAAAVCLFIGVVFRNLGVANLVGSLVMLFSLLFGGFLLNHQTIPRALLWLQSLSIFHYGFEGLIVNEVKYISLTDHKYGIDIEVPGSAILSSFGFDVQALWSDAVGLAVFGAVFMVMAYAAMHVLLVEQR